MWLSIELEGLRHGDVKATTQGMQLFRRDPPRGSLSTDIHRLRIARYATRIWCQLEERVGKAPAGNSADPARNIMSNQAVTDTTHAAGCMPK
jgi:hypothetical protein